jgi:hypothetical protein
LIISDEARFKLSSCVTKRNKRYGSEANPNQMHVKPHPTQRLPIWSGISAVGVTVPYFFEAVIGNVVTLTSDQHVRMVNEVLFPELHRRDIDLATIWCQQDGYTARPSVDTFRTMFEHRIISLCSNISWQARSPDLSACDFFFWGRLLRKQSA